MNAGHPELVIYGLQSNPEEVIPGDVYCCTVLPGDEADIGASVSTALVGYGHDDIPSV